MNGERRRRVNKKSILSVSVAMGRNALEMSRNGILVLKLKAALR